MQKKKKKASSVVTLQQFFQFCGVFYKIQITGCVTNSILDKSVFSFVRLVRHLEFCRKFSGIRRKKNLVTCNESKNNFPLEKVKCNYVTGWNSV